MGAWLPFVFSVMALQLSRTGFNQMLVLNASSFFVLLRPKMAIPRHSIGVTAGVFQDPHAGA